MQSQKALTDALIARLLELHSALLPLVRASYEAANGPVNGSLAFLQLLTDHADFQWLRPLSRLIIDLDDPEAKDAAGGARGLVDRVFSKDSAFYEPYTAILRTNDAVVLIHGDVMRAIAALPGALAA